MIFPSAADLQFSSLGDVLGSETEQTNWYSSCLLSGSSSYNGVCRLARVHHSARALAESLKV